VLRGARSRIRLPEHYGAAAFTTFYRYPRQVPFAVPPTSRDDKIGTLPSWRSGVVQARCHCATTLLLLLPAAGLEDTITRPYRSFGGGIAARGEISRELNEPRMINWK